MPGIGNTTITPGRILLGPAAIWLGVTAPVGAGTQLAITANGSPPDGTNIGATEGNAEFVFRPTINEFVVEQALSPVDFAQTMEEATLAFTVAETAGLTLSKAFQGSTLVWSGLSTAWVYGGGTLLPSSQTLMMIQPRRDIANKYAYIILYKAFIMDAITMPFGRNARTVWKVRMKGLADVTRVVGDQLYQIVPQTP